MYQFKTRSLRVLRFRNIFVLLFGVLLAMGCSNSSNGNNNSFTAPVSIASLQIISTNGDTVNIGSNLQLSAIASYTDGASQDITETAVWESGNEEIATISNKAGSKGLVTAINKGSVAIQVGIDSITEWFTVNVDYAVNTSTVSNVSELRAALLSAENNGMHDVIVLAVGTYDTTSDGLGTFAYTGSDKTNLTLIGNDPASVILSGDGVDRVLYITDISYAPTLFLKNLSIIDGNVTGNGGGFVSYMGECNIDNCHIVNNHAFSESYGGGFIANGKIVINESLIQNNSANNGGGFATYNDIEIIINDSLITENVCNENGGGIYSYGFLKIDNSLISRNKATIYGGGIYSYYDGVNDQVITNSIISYNEVSMANPFAEGGGIYGLNQKYHILKTIVSNNSGSGGSGIYCFNLHLINSIIEKNNSAASSIVISGGNESVIVNTLIMDNTHGVVVIDGTNSYVINSAFLNNGIFDISAADSVRTTVENCFIDENNIDMIAYKGNNIFSNNADDIGFVNESAGNYRLKNTSVMIDAGVLNHTLVDIPQTDMDGKDRPQGNSVDIGPFEYTP